MLVCLSIQHIARQIGIDVTAPINTPQPTHHVTTQLNQIYLFLAKKWNNLHNLYLMGIMPIKIQLIIEFNI